MVREIMHKHTYALGVDFARMGEDKSVFIVIEKSWHDGKLRIAYIHETKHKRLTDAIGRIQMMHDKFNFQKIYLDETGLGAGATDVLIEKLGGIVEGQTFTVASKQDMYNNLKVLLEKGDLTLPNHKKLLYELMDLRFEAMSSGQLKIHHSERGHDDYSDALALAALHFKPRKRGCFAVA